MTENQTTPTDKSKDDALVATPLGASMPKRLMFGNLNWQTQAKAAKARAKRKRIKNAKRKQK